MCAAKASAVSDEELEKALLGTPKAKLVQKAGTHKATEKTRPVQAHAPRKTGLLDIKDPQYSKEVLAEYASNDKKKRQGATFRIPRRDKFYITPEFMLHSAKDPNISGISGRSMVKLIYFAASGIADDYLARAVSLANSTRDQKDDCVSFWCQRPFWEDYAGDSLKEKVSNASGLKKINNSDLYRIMINLIGILAEDGVLEDVLREANDLQSRFGLSLLSD